MGNKQSLKIAEKNFQPSDYTSNNVLNLGLAETHEQVSDTLVEGTIEAKFDNVNGQDLDISK